MIAPLFDVCDTENKGKGLFARVHIPIGTIVCFECPRCRVLRAEDVASLLPSERRALLEHAYTRKDGSILIPCDETVLLNHSCDSNILDTGKGFDVVVRDIGEGEEATYDYRMFYEGLDFAMECFCGAKNCCGTVRCVHPEPLELRALWNEKLELAFANLHNVPQPLAAELRACGVSLEIHHFPL
jgi:hypothetical protein